MELSRRICSLKISPTVALNGKAKKLRAQGLEVLNFAVGEPDYLTPEPIIETAIAALKNGKTKYGPAGGSEALRQAICKKLHKENDLSFQSSQVVCGIGAKEILFHIFLSLLNEGDEVLLTAPFWVSYQDQIKAAGGVPILIPMNGGEPALNPEDIEKYASPKTVAYVLCSPNNPAGYALSAGALTELGQYFSKKDWWIISDEIYEYLSFDAPHSSLLKICPDLQDRFILVNGLSKSFAMTGWRVGYTAGPQQVMNLVKSLQSHSSTCIPPFIEEAATWAVAQGEKLVEEQVQILKKRRDLALDCLQKIPRVNCIKPQGAFYIFVDLREVLTSASRFGNEDSMGFCEYLLEERHLAMVPGEAFGAPGFLRFSYATDEKTITKGLEGLKAAIGALA